MLILARKKDEKIMIGDTIVLSIVEVRGDQVKIGIDAPRDVKVYRHEVFEEIQAQNRAAMDSSLGDLLFPEEFLNPEGSGSPPSGESH